MSEQRRGRSRRAFLRGLGVAGAGAVTGCLGVADGRSTTVAILSAGSLQHALETRFAPAVDVPVRVESHGSATLARMIAEGQRDPDIVTVADTALFESPLSPSWYSVFTSNAVVLAYNPDTEGGRRVAAAGPERWYEPLRSGEVSLGRTDPDQDPLGYRTLFALELATEYYDDAPDLRASVPGREQVYPETSLLSHFETGGLDAAFAYRNMAEERGYDYLTLPDRIDLSDPGLAEWYARVSYELPGGQVVRGAPISYGSTIRRQRDAAVSVFAAHTTGEYLTEAGFLRQEGFPYYEGDVPEAVRRATETNEPPDSEALGARVSEMTLLV